MKQHLVKEEMKAGDEKRWRRGRLSGWQLRGSWGSMVTDEDQQVKDEDARATEEVEDEEAPGPEDRTLVG